jgi:hypothetical protein
MKKPKLAKGDPDMLAEYDFSRAERGKYARRFGGRVGVLLDPDVAEVFDDPILLNNLLRSLAEAVRADRRRRPRKLPARRSS